MGKLCRIPCAAIIVLVASGLALAAPEEQKQEGRKKGPRPAVVNVAEITEGEVQPMNEYVGTVFYSQVSEVAAEVEGRVDRAGFDEGGRVGKGSPLVTLNSEILDARIASTGATYEQVKVELEKAQKDFGRIESLYREGSVSESLYDEYSFRVRGLKKRAAALSAELARLEIEKDKKTIRAPFGGVIIRKAVEVGEWVSAGEPVCTLARVSEVDVVVDVPAEVLRFLKPGDRVAVSGAGMELGGTLRTYIPSGDVATRTFTVKIRLRNAAGLVEGMAARALLPSAARVKGLTVPRDAVIRKAGRDVIFVVGDGDVAKMVPVKVTGYHGLDAGVEGPGLGAGMLAVVKGNERIRDGQPLRVLGKQ